MGTDYNYGSLENTPSDEKRTLVFSYEGSNVAAAKSGIGLDNWKYLSPNI
jgi:hypothetical protein